jgi:tetratricopeptide (TPR) repeat protein
MRGMILVAALLACVASPARADQAADAREHFQKGRTLYDVGKFEEAAREFESAYQMKPDPVLLFNLAQAYRFAGKSQPALIAYRSYLRNLPDAKNRAQVEASIAELQRIVDEQQQAQKSPPVETLAPGQPIPSPAIVATTVTPAPPPKRPLYKRWWLWTAVGAVVATGLAVGLGVGLSQPTERVLPPAMGAP